MEIKMCVPLTQNPIEKQEINIDGVYHNMDNTGGHPVYIHEQLR